MAANSSIFDITEADSHEATTDQAIVSVREEAKGMLLYRLGMGIHVYYFPVMVPLGIIGNLLSLLVMTKRQNRELSICSYMAVLAVMDTLMLSIGGEYWLFTVAWTNRVGPDFLLECKINTWIVQFVSFTGTLVIISMTVDRVIAVCLPLRARALCTVFRARLVSLMSLLISMLYNLPHIFASGLIDGTRICVGFRYTNQALKIYSWINTCLNSAIPFMALLIMNSILIHRLRNRKILESGLQLVSSAQSSHKSSEVKRSTLARKSRERQMTVMLLVVTFTLLALTLPLYVRLTIFTNVDFEKDAHIYSLYVFLSHLTNKLFYTNNAVNFYLYCLAGPKFRKDLVEMFRRCRCTANAVAPEPTADTFETGRRETEGQ